MVHAVNVMVNHLIGQTSELQLTEQIRCLAAEHVTVDVH